MRYPTISRLFALGLLWAALTATPALAAPQILAVLAVDGVPLVCRDGQCRAELSTFCLQRDRAAPHAGSVYVPAEAGDFRLSVKTAAGETRDYAARDHVAFVESRGFMSIAAVIKESDLERLGGSQATISITELASLLPVPHEGDPDPLSEREIAQATSALRQLGADAVDKRPAADAAKLLARVVNAVPSDGFAPPGAFEDIWQDAIGDELPGAAPAGPATSRAKSDYSGCVKRSGRGGYGSFRRCLEFRHDELIRGLNIDYWNRQVGS